MSRPKRILIAMLSTITFLVLIGAFGAAVWLIFFVAPVWVAPTMLGALVFAVLTCMFYAAL